MTPASQIVERCGGFKTVAEWLNLDRSGVQRWTYPAPRGTGERIPTQHWAPLIRKAAEHGIAITIEELVPQDAAQAAAEARRLERSSSDQGAAA